MNGSPGAGRSLKVALLMVALIGGFYLLREHWNHVAGNWVYLLLPGPANAMGGRALP